MDHVVGRIARMRAVAVATVAFKVGPALHHDVTTVERAVLVAMNCAIVADNLPRLSPAKQEELANKIRR